MEVNQRKVRIVYGVITMQDLLTVDYQEFGIKINNIKEVNGYGKDKVGKVH
jgi:hypothetical protein